MSSPLYCHNCFSYVRTARYRRIARATGLCTYCGAKLKTEPPPAQDPGDRPIDDPGATSAKEREEYLATDQAQD